MAFKINDTLTWDGSRFLLMAGNCILEDKDTSFRTAEFLSELSRKLGVDLIYKSSYKKDNRSSTDYYTGPSMDESMRLVEDTKSEFGLPGVSDGHYPTELDEGAAEVLDVLQVPAYLAMQTELVTAIARVGKPINLKKAQFLHPEDMGKVVAKVESTGNKAILLTERGTCFGYRDMVVDPRSFHIMKETGYPVIFDAGHSVRIYGVPSADPRGGAKHFLNVLMSASAAADLAGLFVEVHPDPPSAKCDAASQLSFSEAEHLITRYFRIASFVRSLNGEEA